MPYAKRAPHVPAPVPRLKYPPKKVATARLISDDDGWYVEIKTTPQAIIQEIGPFATPGAALDRLVKWAKDRRLHLPLEGLPIEVIRPGKHERKIT